MQTDLVIVSEYCQKCHIDPSFIILLEEGGLIDINITDGERYLFSSQLRDLEQYTRMYYDLSINIEGIEAIHHMLDRMRNLQAEIQSLRNRLHLYEPFGLIRSRISSVKLLLNKASLPDSEGCTQTN